MKMTTDNYLVRTAGDWIQLLANENDKNDAIHRNHHVLLDNQFDFELPSSFDPNVFYTKVQHCRYLCGACGENVLEQHLTEHHSSEHAGAPYVMEMYELFEIDECFKCNICNLEQLEADLTNHLTDCHHREVINYYYEPYTPSPSLSPTPPPPMSPMAMKPFINYTEAINVPGHFLCLVCCVSNIHHGNLQKHRKKLHSNISQRVNIFSQQPNRKKFQCNWCKNWLFEKNVEKHCKKYHPHAIDDPATDGFHNIRISNPEFQRMQCQNRIYELNGIQYLKDSE